MRPDVRRLFKDFRDALYETILELIILRMFLSFTLYSPGINIDNNVTLLAAVVKMSVSTETQQILLSQGEPQMSKYGGINSCSIVLPISSVLIK